MPAPRSFDVLFALAAARKGGPDAFEKTLPTPKAPTELAAIPDDRWLAAMTRAIFQAGFSWKVIAAKWPVLAAPPRPSPHDRPPAAGRPLLPAWSALAEDIMMTSKIAAITLAACLTTATAAAQTQQMSYICDLQGAQARMNVALEIVSTSGITWGPGSYPQISGLIPTGEYNIYTAGEMRSSNAYYTFTGEGEYAQFTDHVQGGTFVVRFILQPGGLVMIINPFQSPEGQGHHFCQRVGYTNGSDF